VILAGRVDRLGQQYRTITTARGEVVEVADAGVYRYSPRRLVTGGAPWDVVWLGLAVLPRGRKRPAIAGTSLEDGAGRAALPPPHDSGVS
jgi:hypothetical protein